MQMRPRAGTTTIALSLAVSAALLAACGPADDEGAVGVDPPEEAVDDDIDEQGEADVGDEDGERSDSREVTMATADAAERLDVAEEQVELVTFEMVTWPDGAMGCPEPERMYTQALVEGYRIVVAAQGTELTYHGATGDDPFLCEDPQAPVSDS